MKIAEDVIKRGESLKSFEELPRLLINYKAYDEAIGEKSLKISKAAKRVQERIGVKIAVMPMLVDLKENSRIIECYSQGVESIREGAFTGHITINQIKEGKAKGVVLNHSEKRIGFEEIKKTAKMLKEEGLKVIVCCENSREAKKLTVLEVDGIALEPKELIGTGRAISKEKPEEVVRALEVVDKPLYIGAGIVSKEDVEKGLKLGAYGILVASAVVKAREKEKKIEELTLPFKKFERSEG